MYVYMYFWERRPRRLTRWLYIFGEKWLGNDYLTFCSFFSASVWKWHAPFMYSIYGIQESDVSQENIYYIIWYLKRNNCVLKNIFIVYLLLQRGLKTSLIPLITLFYITFLRTLILFDDISLHLNFQSVYYVGERLCYYMRLLKHTCDYF